MGQLVLDLCFRNVLTCKQLRLILGRSAGTIDGTSLICAVIDFNCVGMDDYMDYLRMTGH